MAGDNGDIPVPSHYFVIILKCSSEKNCSKKVYESLAFVLPQWYSAGSTKCVVRTTSILLFDSPAAITIGLKPGSTSRVDGPI